MTTLKKGPFSFRYGTDARGIIPLDTRYYGIGVTVSGYRYGIGIAIGGPNHGFSSIDKLNAQPNQI